MQLKNRISEDWVIDVVIATYNHEFYIGQCLEGVLSQKTDFPFRIIIGDDCSTDGTQEIIKQYCDRYPKIINSFLRNRNTFKDLKRNGILLLEEVDAKYIVLLDGDDYWCDNTKLQKQIDFLEANPDYAICFHNARILKELNPEEISYSNGPDQKEVSSFEDLALGKYIYTATCVFRRAHFEQFPHKYYQYLNDYTIDLHNAQFGKIKYMNTVMSVYRVHDKGIWSMAPRLNTLVNHLPNYQFYLHYFDKKYRHYFITHVQNITKEIMNLKVPNKDFNDFFKYYFLYVRYNINVTSEYRSMGSFLKKAIIGKLRILRNKLTR